MDGEAGMPFAGGRASAFGRCKIFAYIEEDDRRPPQTNEHPRLRSCILSSCVYWRSTLFTASFARVRFTLTPRSAIQIELCLSPRRR